jgi:hypothetical protein
MWMNNIWTRGRGCSPALDTEWVGIMFIKSLQPQNRDRTVVSGPGVLTRQASNMAENMQSENTQFSHFSGTACLYTCTGVYGSSRSLHESGAISKSEWRERGTRFNVSHARLGTVSPPSLRRVRTPAQAAWARFGSRSVHKRAGSLAPAPGPECVDPCPAV